MKTRGHRRREWNDGTEYAVFEPAVALMEPEAAFEFDVVDELGHALGLDVEPDEEFHATNEIFRERDRLRWRLDEAAADAEEGRPPRARRRRLL